LKIAQSNHTTTDVAVCCQRIANNSWWYVLIKDRLWNMMSF